MRKFNNEDILLSGDDARKLLNALLIPRSDSSEYYEKELRNASFNDTEEGTVFDFPELEIDIHAPEPKMEVSCSYNVSTQRTLLYSTESLGSSLTNTELHFENIVKKSSDYLADKKHNQYSYDGCLEALLRIA